VKRHEMWKSKYPNRPKARGLPFTGIENARPETRAIVTNFEELQKDLPFDPIEYVEGFELPEKLRLTQRINAVD